MGGIGGPELLVVVLVVLLIFGPRKIPEVARGVGKGLREIRRLTTEFQREINLSDAEEDRRRIGSDPPARPPGPPVEPRVEGVPRREPGAGDAPAAPEASGPAADDGGDAGASPKPRGEPEG